MREHEGREDRKKAGWMDGVTRSVAKSKPTEGDTRDRDRWRNLVLGEGNQLYNGMNVYVCYYE